MSDAPLKLHCLYTGNFEPMLIRFLSGLHDISNPVLINISELLKDGVGGVGGGPKLWRFKINLLLNLADPAKNPEPVVHLVMDIDMAVYGPLQAGIRAALGHADIVFQTEDDWKENANIGIIAFRPGPRVLAFWRRVHAVMLARPELWDQDAANIVIRQARETGETAIALLPETYWAFSQGPHTGYAMAPRIVLHHANCVSGLAEKWVQLNRFAGIFRQERDNHGFAYRQMRQKLSGQPWVFGNLSHYLPYRTITVAPDGAVLETEHANETTLKVAPHGLYFSDPAGNCTTFFDEFYYDPFRARLLCVGRFCTGEDVFHYLMSPG